MAQPRPACQQPHKHEGIIFQSDKGRRDAEITTINWLLPGGGADGWEGISFPIFNLQEPCKLLMKGTTAMQEA